MPLRALVALSVLLCAGSASAARAQERDEPRVLFGVEAAAVFAVGAPYVDRYLPGPSLSGTVLFSVTRWLMPLVRLRRGVLVAASGTETLGSLGGALLGVRFRPRGIAHPEETPRATCVWAEIDAGIESWNGLPRPVFEAAVGFTFEVGELGVGPVVRFLHVFPTASADGPDPFLMTVGLELLLGDARGAPGT